MKMISINHQTINAKAHVRIIIAVQEPKKFSYCLIGNTEQALSIPNKQGVNPSKSLKKPIKVLPTKKCPIPKDKSASKIKKVN